MFTGDLLFAGSIGRTDLPGGDYQTILDSLARVCLPLPDETVVLSGHGPADHHRRGAGVQSVPGRARARLGSGQGAVSAGGQVVDRKGWAER